jgi:circadian clock protein KaiC
MSIQNDQGELLQTGIPGLDEVLSGGLARHRLYLLEGDPGSGKTTLSLQFLMEGVRRGEKSMFVTLSESKEELLATAKSHGWNLEGIEFLEIIASEEALTPDARYTMYHPSEVELGETTRQVLAEAERMKPSRLVVDSLSEIRMLAGNPLRYRRQILALKHHFTKKDCTVIFVDDRTNNSQDKHLHSLAHGVICMDRQTGDYGTIRRRIEVSKLRGQSFREGFHDFQIRRGGIDVFPRLVAAEHRRVHGGPDIESGLARLDSLMGGGISKGTSTLITGAAGTGKSSLASQYVKAAVERGEHAAVFLFDESIATYLERSSGVGIDIEQYVEAEKISLRPVDPAELTPGEFTHSLREIVEKNHSSIVVIDSLNGYLNAMPSDRFLALHIHELLTYLGHKGVTTLMTMTQHGLVGNTMGVPLDVSYIADSVILLRYFEAFGEVKQAISVIKKRTGRHERTIRELRMENGIQVGEPLSDFRGVLTGVPEFVGSSQPKMEPGP